MKHAALVLVPITLAALATWVQAHSPPTTRRPNIVLIIADDLGYGDLGCYGQEEIQTPNIDRLAKEGMRCTNCYAGAAVCSPSRCVLLTGMHTGHARIRSNGTPGFVAHSDQPVQPGRVPLCDEDVTFAEVLKGAGYVTGVIGKWGLGEPGTTGEPNRQGFDEWFGFLNNDHCDDYFTDFLWHNGRRFPLTGNQDNRRTQYTTDLFTERALTFLRENQSRTFLLYLAYTAPHANYEVPDLGLYGRKDWAEQEKDLRGHDRTHG